MEPLWDKGTEVYLKGPGHMTKMSAIPIYGKNASKSLFLQNQWANCLESLYVVLKIRVHHNLMTIGWPWAILHQGQIWLIMQLLEKEWILSIFFYKLLQPVISKLVHSVNEKKSYRSIKGQGHSLTFDQCHSDFKIRACLSLYLLDQLKPNFIWKLIRTRKWKFI